MTYVLPDLDYDYGALAPHIAPEIMELHHSKHHAAYVAGANTALEQLDEARESGNFGAINKLEKDLAFHLGGHVNHSVFWKNMSPEGGGRPDGELAAALDEYFGKGARKGGRAWGWFEFLSETGGAGVCLCPLEARLGVSPEVECEGSRGRRVSRYEP